MTFRGLVVTGAVALAIRMMWSSILRVEISRLRSFVIDYFEGRISRGRSCFGCPDLEGIWVTSAIASTVKVEEMAPRLL